MTATIHAFVDGGYLRQVAIKLGLRCCPDPRRLIEDACRTTPVAQWTGGPSIGTHFRISRVTYYDAEPDKRVQLSQEDSAQLGRRVAYWDAIALLEDTHLGFGTTRRGQKKRREQKGVDTLIAVDMLVGAFTDVYDLAILVSGDADFVPVLDEVRRRGATVVVVAHPDGLADSLRQAADRFVRIADPAERQPHRGCLDHAVLLEVLEGSFALQDGDEAR